MVGIKRSSYVSDVASDSSSSKVDAKARASRMAERLFWRVGVEENEELRPGNEAGLKVGGGRWAQGGLPRPRLGETA
jgi:hypothetical protein